MAAADEFDQVSDLNDLLRVQADRSSSSTSRSGLLLMSAWASPTRWLCSPALPERGS